MPNPTLTTDCFNFPVQVWRPVKEKSPSEKSFVFFFSCFFSSLSLFVFCVRDSICVHSLELESKLE